MEENLKIKKRKFTIFGISIYRILAYFIIYSFLGYVIETIFGIITMGKWQSRQSFLYGPFCGIYGLGAIMFIIPLQRFKDNKYKLFLASFIIGSVLEYTVSLIGELIFNIKWWDYSNQAFNINGRICVHFSIFWGLLGIYLISEVNPKIDRLINFINSKISVRFLKILTVLIMIFFIVDIILTCYALQMFTIRIVHENDLNVEDREKIDRQYEKIYVNDKKQAEFILKYFDNEKMIKTFPNIKILDVDGNILYYDCYVGDIQTYYYNFNEK